MGTQRFSTLLILILSFALITPAQDLITDRPDFTESASTIPLGKWQFEFGYTFDRSGNLYQQTLGELLIRTSLFDNLELRAGINSFNFLKVDGKRTRGLEDFSIGFKWAIVPDHVAIIVSSSLPTGHRELGSNRLQPGITLALAHDVGKHLAFGSNLSVNWLQEGGKTIREAVISTAAGISLSEKMGLFLEYFAFLYQDGGPDNIAYFDAGITYLLQPEFQLDLRIGRGLVRDIPNYFVGIGAVVRR